MDLKIDEDVKETLEFMQDKVSAARLKVVAGAVYKLAPSLWPATGSPVLYLRGQPLTTGERQPVSTE